MKKIEMDYLDKDGKKVTVYDRVSENYKELLEIRILETRPDKLLKKLTVKRITK